MGSPIYHLRPNKSVDRNLFVESLVKLERILDLSNYRYIGFGSYEFDEFKLVYKALGIEDLHSIEMDSDVFLRQSFNKPYSFIKIFNKKCGDYFDEDYEDDKQSIIWLDFSEANNKNEQCQDITNICSKVSAFDILRITFNANASGIPLGNAGAVAVTSDEKKIARFDWVKNNLSEFIPDDITCEDVTTKRYPGLLLKIIKKAVYKNLSPDLFACPINSFIYSDNTLMMTLTIIFGPLSEKDGVLSNLKRAFNGWEQYVNINSWDKQITIDLPPLTVHEQLELRQYSTDAEAINQIEEKMGIKEDEIKRYLLFARYYPNYQPVLI